MAAKCPGTRDGAPPRKRGRPRMAECPELRERNLWFVFQRSRGQGLRQIAAGSRVSVQTVLRGIAEAVGYPNALHLTRRDVQERDDEA